MKKVKKYSKNQQLIIQLLKKKFTSFILGLIISYLLIFVFYKTTNSWLKYSKKTRAQIEPIKTQNKKEKIIKKTDDFIRYVVQEGDTLCLIAEKFYQNCELWTKIAEKNNLSNPDIVEVGTTLIIPK
ncbi:MAG: LysM peptidoglycan-binding domain-containing protein [Patescibacteria group bacterium]|nr:LysM peptidoglycan-binding domain-containing protein [Patescibacteria group bacterium]